MLNTKFLLKILQNNDRLKNKIVTYQYGRFASWNITIIDDVKYVGYNLKGCDLDFVDLRRSEIAEFSDKVKVSIQPITFQNKIYETKSIDLPVYPSSYQDAMRCADLTMNTLIISWSDVLKDRNGEYMNEYNIDYDWRPKIKNPIDDIDGVTDAMLYNVKTWGNNINDIKYVLRQQKPKIHIWRVVKMYVKLNGKCVVDKKLIRATIEMYPVWFTKERLSEDDEHCKKIAHFFVNLYSEKGKINTRFECFEMLKFNLLFQQNVDNVLKFKKCVIMEMENIKDEAMKNEMKR
eukprot:509156_1